MKIFMIGVALAYNPFEIKNEIPDCLDQCGGIGGKCEETCGPSEFSVKINWTFLLVLIRFNTVYRRVLLCTRRRVW